MPPKPRHLLVRRPSPQLEAGEVTHLARTPVDAGLALEQWDGYVDAFREHGWRVTAVPVTGVLHLKSGVTALPDGTVIGWEPNVEDPAAYPDFLPVPEEHGTAVVDVAPGVLVMSADAPRTAELLEARGLRVHRVALSEFEKLEGCVTCLSVRLRS